MRTFIRAAALLALAAPIAAGAQQWRTVESARQLGENQQPLTVTVKYAAGKLDLAPVDEPLLYQMRIRYDEQLMDAVHEYDPSQHRLELGLDNANVGWRALRGRHSSIATASPSVAEAAAAGPAPKRSSAASSKDWSSACASSSSRVEK